MAILNRLMAARATSKMRNSKCKCGSGLKFKNCHGDPEKSKIVNTVANLAMNVLINYQRQRSRLITEEECDGMVGRLQEMMYNLLDPDYEIPEPEPATVVVESEDRKRENQERCEDCGRPDCQHCSEEAEIPEPETSGTEKIDSIRESAGVDRCPKCLGVKLVSEDMCYKCKKGNI